MPIEKLTKKEVELLNSKVGLKVLFSNPDIDLEKVLERTRERVHELEARLEELERKLS